MFAPPGECRKRRRWQRQTSTSRAGARLRSAAAATTGGRARIRESSRCASWLDDRLVFGRVFGEDEPPALGIVVEDFRVASPVHGSLELALDFILAEVLVEDVMKKFFRDGVVGLGVQNILNRLQDGHVPQGRL